MNCALSHAQTALDAGEFPVGCVMVLGNQIISSGQRENSSRKVNELDHAEMVALRNFYHKDLQDINMSDIIVYSTMEPCLMCFASLIVNGVRKFVYSYEDVMGGGTNLPVSLLAPLYKDARIYVEPHVLRPKSLKLFKEFFGSELNNYLKGSLLANYTLQQ